MDTTMSTNIEELLKPRYKVMAAYPKSRLEVGKILTIEGDKDDIDGFALYPHLFRKLEWWEERSIEQLPKYMKWKNNDGEWKYAKVDRWEIHGGYPKWWITDIKGDAIRFEIEFSDFPATEAEYLTFKNK